MTELTPGRDSALGAESIDAATSSADHAASPARNKLSTLPTVTKATANATARARNARRLPSEAATGTAPVEGVTTVAPARGRANPGASQPVPGDVEPRDRVSRFRDGRELTAVTPKIARAIDPAAVEAGIVALWRSYGDNPTPANRDRLVLHYAPLVKYVAGRVATGLPAHIDLADLVQVGIFGLVDAIERFEPDRGLKFETYAMQRIRGAILDDLRAQDWVPRSVRGRAREVQRAMERLEAKLHRSASDAEIAEELCITVDELRDLFAELRLTSVVALDELVAAGRGGSLAETLQDHRAEDPLAAMEDRENRRLLAEAIAHLGARDRTVVTLYYFESLTLAEIGKVLGVTESRVCQLHTRAVLRLRTKLSDAAAG